MVWGENSLAQVGGDQSKTRGGMERKDHKIQDPPPGQASWQATSANGAHGFLSETSGGSQRSINNLNSTNSTSVPHGCVL